MAKILSLKDARLKPRLKPKPPRRKKPVTKCMDSGLSAGVVFELQSIYGEGESNFAYRHRVRLRNKGGISENLYDYGANEYLVGDVCESIGVNKWSRPTFGMVPTAHIACIRQIPDDKLFEVGK